jgi:hypothetical protein
MKHRFCITLAILALFAVLPALRAQANPTAIQRGTIQAGVGYLYLNNDYTERKNGGLTLWGDYDFAQVSKFRIGVDATLNFGGIRSPDDIGENTYLVGPRFNYRRHKVELFAKALIGSGTISNQDNNTSSSFTVYSFGGGVDYRIQPRFKIRAEGEQQLWPSFQPSGLSPFAVSVGVLYVIR